MAGCHLSLCMVSACGYEVLFPPPRARSSSCKIAGRAQEEFSSTPAGRRNRGIPRGARSVNAALSMRSRPRARGKKRTRARASVLQRAANYAQ